MLLENFQNSAAIFDLWPHCMFSNHSVTILYTHGIIMQLNSAKILDENNFDTNNHLF